jgi:hypothetical protein
MADERRSVPFSMSSEACGTVSLLLLLLGVYPKSRNPGTPLPVNTPRPLKKTKHSSFGGSSPVGCISLSNAWVLITGYQVLKFTRVHLYCQV